LDINKENIFRRKYSDEGQNPHPDLGTHEQIKASSIVINIPQLKRLMAMIRGLPGFMFCPLSQKYGLNNVYKRYVMKNSFRKLIEEAAGARLNAYAPYSEFAVGSAVLTDNGSIFTGCNIENASFGLSICAERVAIFKAISSGSKTFKAIAIVGNTKGSCAPCGACRQVMIEFSPEMDVIMSNLHYDIKIKKVKELLPDAFQSQDMKNHKQ